MRVLIVEDDALTAMQLSDDVGDAGHDLLGCATSAWAARDFVYASQPDVMLVDIHLDDGETGCDLARDIRAELNIPTIFVTGSPAKARTCDHALGVLTKPFTANAVTAALDAAEVIRAGGKPVHVDPQLELF